MLDVAAEEQPTNHRVFLATAVVLGVGVCRADRTTYGASSADILKLLPYPQEVKLQAGGLLLGPADCKSDGAPSQTQQIALKSLSRYLPQKGTAVNIRLGSVEEGYFHRWLTDELRSFLSKPETSPEASVLMITPTGITVVGKGKWGMLYGLQTVNQLAIQAARENRDSIPCLTIRDWPDARCQPAGSGAEMPEPVKPAIAAFAPHRVGNSGVTVAEYELAAIASVKAQDR